MNEELEVLKLVSQRLEKAAIPHMITGSVAVNFYALPRMTRDIDIVIEVKKEDADLLLDLFKNDFYIDQEMILEAIRDQSAFNIIHNQYVIKVDFIVRKKSIYRELELSRRRPIDIEGTKMWIVSPEDLVLSKLFWAKDSLSEMQLGDVKNILGTVKNLDMGYIEKWVQTLDLSDIYQKVKS